MINRLLTFWMLGAFICVLTVWAPKVHRAWLRNKVGQEVVIITNPSTENHGGTGVHVKTPNGHIVILTNDHICDGVGELGYLKVKTEDMQEFQLVKILARSDASDLCVVEGLPKHKGLNFSKYMNLGEIYHMIGHPELDPITMVEGELIGPENITLMDHALIPNSADCKLPKNKIQGPICLISLDGVMSTLTTLHGNSGSPLVNDFGQIVALAFLTGGDVRWGSFVPLDQINTFLKDK